MSARCRSVSTASVEHYTNLSIPRINAWKVYFANELYSWWFVGVIVTAVHLHRVDAVFMDALYAKPVSTVLRTGSR
jgi:hypothetical protein